MGIQAFCIPDESKALQAGDLAQVSFDGYLKGIENKYYTMDLTAGVLFYNQDGSTYVGKGQWKGTFQETSHGANGYIYGRNQGRILC